MYGEPSEASTVRRFLAVWSMSLASGSGMATVPLFIVALTDTANIATLFFCKAALAES